jgi:hypothetical protein
MTSPQASEGPFDDAALKGIRTAATEAVETIVESLPPELLEPSSPRTEMLVGAWVDQGGNWLLAHRAIDLLGTLLSDQFGAMQLDAPTLFMTYVAFCLDVLVPDDVDRLQPLLESAIEKVVRQAVGPDVDARFLVMPKEEAVRAPR